MSEFTATSAVKGDRSVNGENFDKFYNDLESRNLKDGKHIRYQNGKDLYLHKDGASLWHILSDLLTGSNTFAQLRLQKQLATGEPFYDMLHKDYGAVVADQIFKDVFKKPVNDPSNSAALSGSPQTTGAGHRVEVTWGDVKKVKAFLDNIDHNYVADNEAKAKEYRQQAEIAAQLKTDEPYLQVGQHNDEPEAAQAPKQIACGNLPDGFTTLLRNNFELFSGRSFLDSLGRNKSEFKRILAQFCYSELNQWSMGEDDEQYLTQFAGSTGVLFKGHRMWNPGGYLRSERADRLGATFDFSELRRGGDLSRFTKMWMCDMMHFAYMEHMKSMMFVDKNKLEDDERSYGLCGEPAEKHLWLEEKPISTAALKSIASAMEQNLREIEQSLNTRVLNAIQNGADQ